MSVPVTLPHSTVSATMDLPEAGAAPKVPVPMAATVVIPETEALEGVMANATLIAARNTQPQRHKQ